MPVTVLTFADMLAEHMAAGFEQVARWDVPRRASWAPEQPELIDQALLLAHPETGVFAHLSQYTASPGLTPWVNSVRWAFNALVFDIAAFRQQLPPGNGHLLQPGVVRRVDAGRRFEDVAAGVAGAGRAEGFYVGGWELGPTHEECGSLLERMRAHSVLVTPHRLPALDYLHIEPPIALSEPVDRVALEAWKVARAAHLDRVVEMMPTVAQGVLLRAG